MAMLIATMSRLQRDVTARVSAAKCKLDISEWVVLSLVADSPGIGNSQLATRIGVTRQRITQVITRLVDAKLIATKVSTKDARILDLNITDGGKRELSLIDTEVERVLSGCLRERPSLLVRIISGLRVIDKGFRISES